jgi:hypothetical protein
MRCASTPLRGLRSTASTRFSSTAFNHQNALFGLLPEDISDRQLEMLKWNVGFDSSFGLAATFMCEEIEVLRAVPFDPPGHITDTQQPPSPAP